MMNANNPQTPGVYTVEKNAFPPSVAEVPTAIPAFIGYTETATNNGKSLVNTPTYITSLSEYNIYFGGAPEYQFPIINVPKNDDGTPPAPDQYDFTINAKYYKIGSAEKGLFYMYNSLRLFYLNGGGPCYIVSVGTYMEPSVDPKTGKLDDALVDVDRDALMNGLSLLPNIQFPKPTMILIPDALALDSNEDCYVIQQQMILQAGELMDRVALLDVYDGWQGLDTTVISDFRNSMGVNYLSYAIAYYPWLETAVVDAAELTYANLYPHPGTTPTDTSIIPIDQIILGQPLLGKLSQLTTDLDAVQKYLMVPPAIKFSGASDAVSFPTWNAAFNGSPSTDPADILSDMGVVLLDMYQTLLIWGVQELIL